MEEKTLFPGPAVPAGAGDGSIFAQLGDESRLEVGLPVYRKVRAIGQGAFGKAYLVEAVRGRRRGKASSPKAAALQRVLKKLPLSGIPEDRREAAFREALLMRRISRGCPFITQFAEVFLGKAGTMLCIVMEFCSGGDLRSVLRDRDECRPPEAQVLAWAAQLSLALHHCHVQGVVHRDVKPENCFFRTRDGDLLLGDFGISCALDERSFAKTCVGSPMYMSPEVVNQDRYSFATDAWSLGVLLYEAAMLAPPFKGTNICQLAFRIVTGTPEPLDAAFSGELHRLVERLLVKDPAQRPTLAEVLVAPPLEAPAAALAALHSLPWPPSARPGSAASAGSSSLVQRIRGHVAGGSGLGAGALAEEEVAYGDDFEEASDSEASYEPDFEAPSEDDEQAAGRACPALDELSEAQVRRRIREELGEEALAAAERVGIVSFLGGVGSAGQPVVAHS